MNLIRKYKIYKLLLGEVDDKTKKIFDKIENNLLDLKKFETKKFPNVIYYMNLNGLLILRYEKNNIQIRRNLIYICNIIFFKYFLKIKYKIIIDGVDIFDSSEKIENLYKKEKGTF